VRSRKGVRYKYTRGQRNIVLYLLFSSTTTTTKTMASQGETSRPLIVILALDKADFYNDLHTDFNNLLKSHADVEYATTPSEARAFFDRAVRPAAILSADESLTISTRLALAHEAASWVRSGGTLVFMGIFSGFVRPSDMELLFSKFDLPWAAGDYHRTTFSLNPAMKLLETGGMASSYSQKAVHVKNVQHSDAVYLPSSESQTESAVFPPQPVGDRTQTPAAFARVGAGKVGYVGDVNNESDTTTVVLRMCGLVV
jgi:hypothetical protein